MPLVWFECLQMLEREKTILAKPYLSPFLSNLHVQINTLSTRKVPAKTSFSFVNWIFKEKWMNSNLVHGHPPPPPLYKIKWNVSPCLALRVNSQFMEKIKLCKCLNIDVFTKSRGCLWSFLIATDFGSISREIICRVDDLKYVLEKES